MGARGGEVLGGTKPTFSQPNNGPGKLMKPFSSKIWLKLIFKFAEKKVLLKNFSKMENPSYTNCPVVATELFI